MKLSVLKCPCCNANIDIEDGIDTFYCKYCGAKIILEEQSGESINAKVRIKEFEHVERMKDKEYAHEHFKMMHESAEKRYFHFWNDFPLVAIMLGCLVIIGITSLHKGSENRKLEKIAAEVEREYAAGDYDSALMEANRLVFDSHLSSEEAEKWDVKREYYIKLIEEAKRQELLSSGSSILIPQSSKTLIGKSYQDAVTSFKAAGFTDIKTVELPEDTGFFKRIGTVDHISINGNSEFTTDDYYPKDASIIIYHYPDKK